ncbi:MAG: hypothetical protein ACLUSL_13315 [Ruminococcus sp.]
MNVRTKNLICACRRLEETTSPAQKWRPQFHLSPPTGWMNDPNGLCQFRGSHHIFFQYSPFDVQTGLNYWGHFRNGGLRPLPVPPAGALQRRTVRLPRRLLRLCAGE